MASSISWWSSSSSLPSSLPYHHHRYRHHYGSHYHLHHHRDRWRHRPMVIIITVVVVITSMSTYHHHRHHHPHNHHHHHHHHHQHIHFTRTAVSYVFYHYVSHFANSDHVSILTTSEYAPRKYLWTSSFFKHYQKTWVVAIRVAATSKSRASHDCNVDVIKWKLFPRYWPFVRGIHLSPVDPPHKCQWLGALIFSLTCPWTNGRANNRDPGDLRRHCTHYDVSVIMVTRDDNILKMQ